MAFSQKKIIFGAMFLLGILLGYNVCSQFSTAPVAVEITAENDTPSSCFDFNSDGYEEDQLVFENEFVAIAEVYTQHQFLLVNCQLFRPYCNAQPPKHS